MGHKKVPVLSNRLILKALSLVLFHSLALANRGRHSYSESRHPKLVFGDNCLLCLRCSWICPQGALSHKIMGPFLLKCKFTLPD